MYSIKEARARHTHATYNIPTGVRHDCGIESIVRELEAEAAAAHRGRRSKFRKLATALYRRITGSPSEIATEQPINKSVALVSSN